MGRFLGIIVVFDMEASSPPVFWVVFGFCLRPRATDPMGLQVSTFGLQRFPFRVIGGSRTLLEESGEGEFTKLRLPAFQVD